MSIAINTHSAIIGASGAGKTVTAKVMVEDLLTQGRHVAIIDPLGVWWGLRALSDGSAPAFDIPIFGGDHGDIAIRPEHGSAVGKLLADGMSAIVDVSAMEARDARMFMLGLLRSLRQKPKSNFHLVVDEADEFAPQTAPDDAGFQLVEQMTWIAKRGRTAGFVLTVITQRPADIAKAVLSQMQTIVAHQLIAPQDQKALDDYLKSNGDTATRKNVMASLASLQRGERWIYSPRAGELSRGVTQMPATFDSSRTPEPGEVRHTPTMLAQIDIEKIRAAFAPAPESADQSGPINDASDVARLKVQITALQDEHAINLATGQQQIDGLLSIIARARDVLNEAFADTIPAPKPVDTQAPAKITPGRPKSGPTSPLSATMAPPCGTLSGPQRTLLAALAWWAAMGHHAPSRAQVAAIAGWKITSGHLKNISGSLKSIGLISYPEPGHFSLTNAGAALAPTPDMGRTLREYLSSTLTGPQKQVVEYLWSKGASSREDLCSALGWAATSGHVKNVLGSLRTLEIVHYPERGAVDLQDWAR